MEHGDHGEGAPGGEGTGQPREGELAWKVAMQRQMLEQQEMHQHMNPSGPPPPPAPAEMSEDLMMKVRQQQQLLDMEKQREAQQKLMEQQQLALLEAQRNEQQQRIISAGQTAQSLAHSGLPTTPAIRSSGVSMVSAPLQPAGIPPAPPQGMAPPGVVIPQGTSTPVSMAQNAPAQRMAGPGAPPMGMQQPGPPQVQQGGPQAQQGGPQMQQSGPHMQQGGPPQMQQGGPPQMQQGGPPQMQQGGPPQMQQGGPPQMQQGGPPQMQQGGPPQMMQGGPAHPQQMGDNPSMSHGGPANRPQGGPPPLLPQGPPLLPRGGPQQMGDRAPLLSQGGPPQMSERPPLLSHAGDRPPLLQQAGPPSMGERPPHLQQGGPQQMVDRPGERQAAGPMHMQQTGPLPRGPPPPLMGPGMRPQGPGQDSGGPPRDQLEAGPRPRLPRTPYNGPSPLRDARDMKPAPPAQMSGPGQGPKEMRLPQALEKMLEFKSQRAHEFGVDLDTIDSSKGEDEEESVEENKKTVKDMKRAEEVNEEDDFEEDDSEVISESKDQNKESKNKRKKKKKKKARKNRFEQQKKPKKKEKKSRAPEVQVEYIQEELELDPLDPSYNTFAKIFETFKITEPEKPKEIKPEEKDEMKVKEEIPIKAKGILDDDDDDDEDDKIDGEEDGPKISKKKLKKLTRLTVAQLKQLVTRPDVVEMHDVTARDPRLLVHLKATRNSVPVPRHWSFKRKYLQGKRGIEKTPFELPDFIKATGIEEMRAALQEKEDQKTLKSKMREKVRPKMGKIDIDYEKLHDAFFRFQTKPKMTIHGDLYYEAKEFETKLREKKPGNLSDDLKMALGMPIGNNSEKVPPPWLIAMQRYGPPPSYPNLKIPGLNAPIPEGCLFGYHAGGWGKPPVDEHGKPLYGDVFGTQSADFKTEVEEDEIDRTQWGELESESESEEESEEEEEEEKDETGLITPAEGLMTPGGITSVPVGMETPDQIELRKKRIEDAMDQGGDTPALYQVLPEKKAAPVGGAMMGSAHVYDITAVTTQKKPGEKSAADTVEVSLNPEELDLDTAAMQAKYEQTVREQQSQLEKEDLSDMVAAHAAKQRKRKKAQQDTGKGAKKYKDFKF